MATIDWPASLPQSMLVDGYNEALQEDTIRDQFETGPPAVRRRTTASPFPVQGQMVMTTAQWETLKTFVGTTLTGRVLPFGFPEQGATSPGEWLVRLVSPPSRVPHLTSGRWLVSLDMEVLP